MVRDWTVGTATLAVPKGDKPDRVVELLVVDSATALSVSRLGKIVRYNVETGSWKTVTLKGPLETLTLHPTLKNVVAVGGEERETEILELDWDSSEKEVSVKSLWQARNVKETRLHLRVPVWIIRIFFLPTSPTEDKEGIYKLLVVARHGQFRIYNSKEGRRPRTDVKVSENPLAVCERGVGAASQQVLVSDTRTSTYVVDMDSLKFLYKLPGGTGAVQALNAFESQAGATPLGMSTSPVIATGGLDRYLRVFDLVSREVQAKIYTGTHITAILVLEGFSEDDADDKTASAGQKRERGDQEEDEAEADELWEQLDEVSKAQDKKKSKKTKKN